MPIPSTIESLSTTANSNGPAGSEQRTLTDDGLRQAYAFIRQLVTLGSNIASASSITPPSTGSSFNITGTTTITVIASTNSWDGRQITLIFAGILTLTHSANLALPGSADITTAANDTATFIQTGSGAWRLLSYGPVSAALTVTGASTLNGNVTLGDAIGDTITIGGGSSKNATGNWTFAAPSSGVGLTQTGFAGSDTAIFNGGTSGSFRVNTTGVPYGTSLHNNAGAVTGTTNQYVCSGTYTPTLTNGANVDASTAYVGQWIRVGNVVTVSGRVDVDPTTAGVLTTLGMSFPIASAITLVTQAAGSAANDGSFNSVRTAAMFGDAANDRVTFQLFTDTPVNEAYFYHYTYVIV
jgi:hypothetical protein